MFMIDPPYFDAFARKKISKVDAMHDCTIDLQALPMDASHELEANSGTSRCWFPGPLRGRFARCGGITPRATSHYP